MKQRRQETFEERNKRLATSREITAISRACETIEQHEAQLQDKRIGTRQSQIAYFNLKFEGFHCDPYKNYSEYTSVTIGKMAIVCNNCQAKKFKLESPGMCCKNGKVKLCQLKLPPQEL